MALELTIEKPEDVDESIRALYVEKDGKYHLDISGLDKVTEESVRNAVATATRKANKEAQEERLKRKQYEKLGMTPEQIEEAITELQTLREKREEDDTKVKMDKGQWDALKQQMNEKHSVEVNKLKALIEDERKKVGELRKRIERHLVTSNAVSAIAEHKGVPQLLLPYVTNHIKVEELENGEFNLKVVDEKGEPLVNGKGDPLTISEFVGGMQSNEVFGRAFEGSGATGGGMRPGNGGAPSHSFKRRSDFKTEKERADFVDQYGVAAYMALPPT
jgi:hypothetical protein